MTFIHPLLLAGLLLVGIPVLIHLIMRQQPRRLPFPAFRFLRQQHRKNRRSLRLRHLLLLGLRILLIAGLCLALARPRLFSERLHFSSDSPVAVALVFDTSPSMEYRVADKSRLDEAKRRANELLDELPEGSRVAVLDSAELGGEWVNSPAQARDRVARLQIRPANAPVTRQIAQAYRLFDRLAQDQDPSAEAPPRFLYVFSDRTPESWDASEVHGLPAAPAAGLQAVFVDVGVDKPADVAVSNLEVPHPIIDPRGRLEVHATVQATGADADTVVTFSIDGETPGEQRSVRVPAGQNRRVSFERRAADLTPGPHRVEVRLANGDSLPFDDVRFATFLVRGGRKVLAVADEPRDARIWKLALDTHEEFRCDVRTPQQLAGHGAEDLLAQYRVVCLIDVKDPPRSLWDLLEAYARKGGGVVVVPGGPELKTAAYNDPVAQRVLPAQLQQLATAAEKAGALWDLGGTPHLLLAPIREWQKTTSVDFLTPQGFPRAWHYWQVAPAQDATVILTYVDKGKHPPALVERALGQGRVILFTTGLDGRQAEKGGPWWNNYLETSLPVVLANLTVGYLAGDAEEPSPNYLAGQAVTVRLPPASRSALYTLDGPGLTGTEAAVPRTQDQDKLQITQAVAAGNYTVRDGDNKVVGGFSINVRPEECQLTRDPDTVKQIESLLGPNAVLPVGHAVSLHDALQHHWRQPVELLPWLMLAVLLALAFENLLANKFYRRPKGEE
ncbi:MAG TPA: BatA domain-containing protein [Gemmataceae bacterium]|nr:BatA domain-containing protein [Gemmataceae bacterium]